MAGLLAVPCQRALAFALAGDAEPLEFGFGIVVRPCVKGAASVVAVMIAAVVAGVQRMVCRVWITS